MYVCMYVYKYIYIYIYTHTYNDGRTAVSNAYKIEKSCMNWFWILWRSASFDIIVSAFFFRFLRDLKGKANQVIAMCEFQLLLINES